ncbi:hypothetical protein FRC00_010924, partial [Tulasnella sp. 408]
WIVNNEQYKIITAKYHLISEPSKGFVSMREKRETLVNCLIEMATRASEVGVQGIDPDVQIALAVLLNTSDDYDKAVDCFKAALEARPDDWVLYNRVGATLANSGRANEALAYYYRALEYNPTYIRARYNMGIACINLKRYDEAASHLLDALVLQESDAIEDAPGEAPGSRGVTSSALWDTLQTTSNHLRRSDLVKYCETRDLDGVYCTVSTNVRSTGVFRETALHNVELVGPLSAVGPDYRISSRSYEISSMQANSSTATGSSRRNQNSDGRSSRSSTSDPSSSRRRRDRATSTTSTTLQKSTGKPGPSWTASVPSNSEPPSQLFQELSLGAPRPPHSKRHLYPRRQESSNRKQGSATTATRAASLPDHLHDTRLQERLEEEGLADIEEDDERARVQRRIVSVAATGTSKDAGFTLVAISTSRGPPERCSPGPSSQPQEEDIDELSSMSISGNNSFRTILARELRALHDGTRSPKLLRSPPPPSRSLTSSPESVIFDNKEAEIIQPNSFLRPKSRAAYPERQGLSLSLEACEVQTEDSSANPLLDSVEAAKPALLLPHAYSSEIPLYGQILPFGGPSEAPIVSPRPVHWISPPKPVPALYGPPSIPYARCPS